MTNGQEYRINRRTINTQHIFFLAHFTLKGKHPNEQQSNINTTKVNTKH